MEEKYCESCFTNLSDHEEKQTYPICGDLEVCSSCAKVCPKCNALVCSDCIKNIDGKDICLKCYHDTEEYWQAWNVENKK